MRNSRTCDDPSAPASRDAAVEERQSLRSSTSNAARRARAAFADAGAGTRAHVRLRQGLAPLDAVERLVPAGGRILDLGCGHGVLSLQMALSSPDRNVHGVDISASKIAHGRAAVRRADLGDRISLEVVDPTWVPEAGGYRAVVTADVLYLLEPEALARTVIAACAAIEPRGTLIIKKIAAEPCWKNTVGMAQEPRSVRLLRITDGAAINPRPVDTVVAVLEDRGWPFEQHPLHRGYHFPHAAVVARRPA